jgi:hypothetical protein
MQLDNRTCFTRDEVYKIIEVTIFTAIDLSGGDIFAYTKYDTDTMLDSMFGVDGSEVTDFDIDEFLRSGENHDDQPDAAPRVPDAKLRLKRPRRIRTCRKPRRIGSRVRRPT